MSFVLPTTITIVDKYPNNAQRATSVAECTLGNRQPTLWDIIKRYDNFKKIVQIALMKDILLDPQAKLTVFIPTDLLMPSTILKACVDIPTVPPREKSILDINFETARTIVNSLIIPSVLTTTMMIQSAFSRYKTRNAINTLIVETPHCVQFEPHTFNKSPFGLILNGKSRILTPDILTSNGVVHTLDTFPYTSNFFR